jgi:hypothetical protein
MKQPTKKEVNDLIKRLRSLAPKRPLTYGESLTVGRLQAHHLRNWADARHTPEINLAPLLNQKAVPVQFVPSYTLGEQSGLTTNGVDGKIQVFINESEPAERQRFSLLHEWKHVLDFTDADRLHQQLGVGDTKVQDAQIEAIANDFAAHVLMPTGLVKSYWFKTQNVSLCAGLFNVSMEAMTRRLTKLGLIERPKPQRYAYFRPTGLVGISEPSSILCAG